MFNLRTDILTFDARVAGLPLATRRGDEDEEDLGETAGEPTTSSSR